MSTKSIQLKLPEDFHRRLKAKAAMLGKTLSAYIMACLSKENNDDDPVLKAFMNAPMDDEPFTDEQKKAVEAAQKENSIGWDE